MHAHTTQPQQPAATPTTASAVDHLMIRSAAVTGHAVKRKLAGQEE